MDRVLRYEPRQCDQEANHVNHQQTNDKNDAKCVSERRDVRINLRRNDDVLDASMRRRRQSALHNAAVQDRVRRLDTRLQK